MPPACNYNARMELDAALHWLAEDPTASVDVAEVALRLAADEYSSLDVEGYLSELDGMAHASIYSLLGFTGSFARSSARVRQFRPFK